ncbi:MAG TPA: preprotein translocase subunit SecE [Candidatus Microsaccharimonas sp.]
MASKSGENVTRISAKTTAPTKDSKKVSKKTPKTPKVRKEPTNPFVKTLFAIGGYFKGAWVELRLVRWPTRSATWGLTFAVILFSAFFVVVILLLDILFKFVFELILK